MDPDLWQKTKNLFAHAVALPPPERDPFLREACGGDRDLLDEVQSLVQAYAEDFLETPLELWGTGAAVPSAPVTPELAGRRIEGFEILQRIAVGGIGEVYEARNTASGEILALKRLTATGPSDPKQRLRFEQEARAAMALDHPNVVRVRAVFEHGDELLMLMEYVEGRTLRQVMDTEKLGLDRALELSVQIADGLAAAHELGIVHRDVKPDNVMVTADGSAKILDFGLVKLVEPENVHDAPTRDRRLVSRDGFVLGSASYMSPEQVQAAEIDGRSDVFSLGALLYEMVKGSRAFDGESTIEIVSAVLWSEPAPLELAPGARTREVERVVRKALAKDPCARFPSMRELREELLRLQSLDSEPPAYRGRGRWRRLRRRGRRG